MGTKEYPGKYDCYANAKSDEPMFIFLGRDRDAPDRIDDWALIREDNGEDSDMVHEARVCAQAMRIYRARLDLDKLNDKFTSYSGGDRPMSPPVELMRDIAAQQERLRKLSGRIIYKLGDKVRLNHDGLAKIIGVVMKFIPASPYILEADAARIKWENKVDASIEMTSRILPFN